MLLLLFNTNMFSCMKNIFICNLKLMEYSKSALRNISINQNAKCGIRSKKENATARLKAFAETMHFHQQTSFTWKSIRPTAPSTFNHDNNSSSGMGFPVRKLAIAVPRRSASGTYTTVWIPVSSRREFSTCGPRPQSFLIEQTSPKQTMTRPHNSLYAGV